MDFIEVNGKALRYELRGSGGHTVALLHEMGGTLESWDLVVPQLAAGRRILRYDTRGAGLSGKNPWQPQHQHPGRRPDGAARMRSKSATGSCWWEWRSAARLRSPGRRAYPERVAAVVASSPPTGIAADRRAAVLARVERMEREGLRGARGLDNGYPAQLRGDAPRFAAFRARWLGSDPASFAAIYRMLVELDLGSELARISCQVLLIAGALDATPPARGG
jgi:3-oxoadipate enol-lactonase